MPTFYTSYTQQSRPKKHTKLKVIFVLLLLITGFLIWHIETNQQKKTTAKTNDAHNAEIATVSGTAAPVVKQASFSTQLENDWSSNIAGRQGAIDVAVYDSANGKTMHDTNVDETFDTASIVKLSILEATLLQDQAAGQSITADQLANATPMIENSDNDAATALWNDVGGPSSMNTFFGQIGANSTQAVPENAWGLTQTTALDQLKIVNAMAYPGAILSTSSASVITGLLDQVEADQRWGVSGGVPSGVTVELKDGWLPDADTNDPYSNTNDWTVNSIGHVYGNGVDYTIAVLTEGNPSEQYGIDTIQSLSGVTWTDLASQT